jgi:putative inorganic carbon (hco3(-)) transporter
MDTSLSPQIAATAAPASRRGTPRPAAIVAAAILGLALLPLLSMLPAGAKQAIIAVGFVACTAAVFREPTVGLIVFYVMAFMGLHYKFTSLQSWRVSLLFAGLTLVAWIAEGVRTRSRMLSFAPQSILVFGFLALGFLSFLLSVDHEISTSPALDLAKVLLFYFVTVGVARTKPRVDALVYTIGLCASIQAVYGFITVKVFGAPALTGVGASSIADTNDFAAYLLMSAPFTLFPFLSPAWAGFRRIITLQFPFLLLGVTFTGSRGGFLAMVAMLATLFVHIRRKVLFVTLILVGGLLAAPLLTDRFEQRITTIRNYKQDEAAMARINLWKAALRMIAESPAVGVGIGNFRWEAPKYNIDIREPQVAHNTYLQIATEMGVPALMVWLLILAVTYLEMIRVRRRTRDRLDGDWYARHTWTIQLAIVAFAVSHIFLSKIIHELLYLTIALGAALRAIAIEAEAAEAARNPDLEALMSGAVPDPAPPAGPAPRGRLAPVGE